MGKALITSGGRKSGLFRDFNQFFRFTCVQIMPWLSSVSVFRDMNLRLSF